MIPTNHDVRANSDGSTERDPQEQRPQKSPSDEEQESAVITENEEGAEVEVEVEEAQEKGDPQEGDDHDIQFQHPNRRLGAVARAANKRKLGERMQKLFIKGNTKVPTTTSSSSSPLRHNNNNTNNINNAAAMTTGAAGNNTSPLNRPQEKPEVEQSKPKNKIAMARRFFHHKAKTTPTTTVRPTTTTATATTTTRITSQMDHEAVVRAAVGREALKKKNDDDHHRSTPTASFRSSSRKTVTLPFSTTIMFHVWWISIVIGLLPEVIGLILGPHAQHGLLLKPIYSLCMEEKDNEHGYCNLFNTFVMLVPVVWWYLVAYLTGHVITLPRIAIACSSSLFLDKSKNKKQQEQEQGRRSVKFPTTNDDDEISPNHHVDMNDTFDENEMTSASRRHDRKRHLWVPRQRKPIRWMHEKTQMSFRTTVSVPHRRRRRGRWIKNQDKQTLGHEPFLPSAPLPEDQNLSNERHEQPQVEGSPPKLPLRLPSEGEEEGEDYFEDDYEENYDGAAWEFSDWLPLSWYTQIQGNKHHDPHADNDKGGNQEEAKGGVLKAPGWLGTLDPMRLSKFPDSFLMQELLRNQYLHRRPKQQPGTEEGQQDNAAISVQSFEELPDHQDKGTKETTTTKTATLESVGRYGPSTPANSFHKDKKFEYTIHPILKVRGMDIFLTDAAIFDISQDPWFHHNGLRDIPSFVFNVVTQWGNILVYFELPKWVQNFTDCLEEREHDNADVRVLKRFLNGSDDYRNQRLKMIPSVVDGPLAVRVLAPPKKERVIHGSVVPLSWYKHDVGSSPTTPGKKLQPIIVCTIDCVSGRAIRSMAGIIKKYFVLLTIDLAMVVGAPEVDPKTQPRHSEHDDRAKKEGDDEDDGLQACLGLFRFENIDIEACPEFPIMDQPDEEVEKQDLELVCHLTGVTDEELTAMSQQKMEK